MRAAIFALSLSQSWIGVFGYPPCSGFIGVPCYVGLGLNLKCCDAWETGHYVWCLTRPNENLGRWAGINTCVVPSEGFSWCVGWLEGNDYCAGGYPVLSLIEVTNFCLLINTSTATDLPGIVLSRSRPQKEGCRPLIAVEMDLCWIALITFG
jgi:hypothetical protein